MSIELIRDKMVTYKGQTLSFRFNGSRNQVEEFEGIIVGTYDSIFTIMTRESNFLKSFSYSDVLTKKLVVLSR